jgi:addiction module HigA family antidote
MIKPSSEHPGAWVRKNVLPPGLSVTAAAKRLGVSRPTLSNFLNGKASLSEDMATRLAKAFGADAEALLRLQTDYDRALAKAREPTIAVRAYVQSALSITAMQIEAWAERLSSRGELAALLRRLINSTGESLSRVDFPAYENSQRHGWDGVVSAGAATPWIPLGDSGWEFGVNEDPRRKAEGDYRARTDEVLPSEREETTFVFVTPRNWPAKSAWEAAKRATGEWKDVRAFDASDLEQWLETSVAAQSWLGACLPLQGYDIESLDVSWKSWSEVPAKPLPPLPKSLFQPVAEVAGRKLADWLKRPPERPFIIAADSSEEALAALVCACDTTAAAGVGDRVVVVRSAEALAKVEAASNPQTVIVIASRDAEAAASATHRTRYTVIVRSQSTKGTDVDIDIGLVDEEVFRESLLAMGFDRLRADQLANESGLSRTVLRRRLSPVPGVREPLWANDGAVARRLIPLMLVGHWSSTTGADRAVLAALSGVSYDNVEETVADLVAMEDSPIWTAGEVRGIVSKIDALYAVAGRITQADVDRFLEVARVVLSESDPSLDLPEDQRWAANLYGKSRRHSGLLRAGLCETLVLLAVHGDGLLRNRLGFSVHRRVGDLIRSLLTPLDGSTWMSQERDLPMYAEAAPADFLDILEQDLRSPDPKVLALMHPADSGPF